MEKKKGSEHFSFFFCCNFKLSIDHRSGALKGGHPDGSVFSEVDLNLKHKYSLQGRRCTCLPLVVCLCSFQPECSTQRFGLMAAVTLMTPHCRLERAAKKPRASARPSFDSGIALLTKNIIKQLCLNACFLIASLIYIGLFYFDVSKARNCVYLGDHVALIKFLFIY